MISFLLQVVKALEVRAGARSRCHHTFAGGSHRPLVGTPDARAAFASEFLGGGSSLLHVAEASLPRTAIGLVTMEMEAEAFETLVIDELDRLPDDMVNGLENVVFVVEERAENGEDLFGLYDGLALPERGQYGLGELPDRIVVYRRAHLDACENEDELRDEVHTTLVHEIAHFYGIDDEQLHEMGWA